VSDFSKNFPILSSFNLEKMLSKNAPASASASFRFGLIELICLRSYLAEKTWEIWLE